MAYIKENIHEYFKKCKAKVEAEFQKELDRLATEEEPEILQAYDELEEYEREN